MLFAYNDDGRLEVVADEDEARRSFEPDDVRDAVIRFFDSEGRPLAPRFTQGADRKFLGVRIASDPGSFELVPAGDGEESLIEALGPTIVLMSNRWFPDMDAVRAHLKRR